MGHLTTRDAYRNLSDRINWFTQGAPTSETLYKILEGDNSSYVLGLS